MGGVGRGKEGRWGTSQHLQHVGTQHQHIGALLLLRSAVLCCAVQGRAGQDSSAQHLMAHAAALSASCGCLTTTASSV